MIDSIPAVPHGDRITSDEQTLHLALLLWADGSPFSLADLDGVLTATGQSWTWLLARLGERVVTGLLAYDTATGYRVADPTGLKALVIPNVSASAPLALGSALQAEPARETPRDAVACQDGLLAQPATAPDPIHPTMAALTGSCLVCGYPVWSRTAVRARTAFGLAMVALFAAALTEAPAALTIALLAVFAITGFRYLRLAPAPCRHRR
ncbi:hypothetical protein ACIBCT_37435 [Streptosporangium sp. NPDC050855]|uniref:hypothetical protein n=1 Tax=Streptosporangium sp. NPDC050855 TaxID=3366194 RepID=UPI0037B51939